MIKVRSEKGQFIKGMRASLSTEFKKGNSPWIKGKKHTEKAKEKNRLSHIGRIPWNKGKSNIYSEETLCKMRKGSKGNKYAKGSKHPHTKTARKKISDANKGIKCHFWIDGRTTRNRIIRRSIEYRLWREAVFARDNWTCQKCGDNKGGNLNPHHIINFSSCIELRFAIDNGITLCVRCHNKFHKVYGAKNNNQKQLNEFLEL